MWLWPAAVIVWWLPGINLARRLKPSHDAGVLAGVSLGLSFAVAMVLSFIGWLLHLPLIVLAYVMVGAAAISLADLVFIRTRSGIAPLRRPNKHVGAVVVLLVLAAVGAFEGASVGGMFRFDSDGPDHVATLNEIQRTEAYFPTTVFHGERSILGADARKGLLHPAMAAVGELLGADGLTIWRALPALALPLLIFCAYAGLRFMGVGRVLSLVGCVLLMTSWAGGLGGRLPGVAGYPNQIAVALLWLCIGLAARTLEKPSLRTGMALGATAWAALAVHPMMVVFGGIVAALAAAYWLFQDGKNSRTGSALAASIVVSFTLAVPYLAMRLASYHPANPIHTELQGLLFFSPSLFTADPLLMLNRVGWAGLAVYPVALWMLWRNWHHPGRFLGFWLVVVFINFAFNPILVPLLQEKITYLIFRSYWLIPPALALTMAAGLTKRLTIPKMLAAALCAVLFLPGIKQSVTAWSDPKELQTEGLEWLEPIAAAEKEAGEGSVLASDPVTSYLIPALSTQKAACTLDQHAPPNDSLGVSRILQCRDLLSPTLTADETWNLARGLGANGVLVRTDNPRILRTQYWSYSDQAQNQKSEQLSRSPLFERRNLPRGWALFLLSSADSVPPENVHSTPSPSWMRYQETLIDTLGVRVAFAESDTKSAPPGGLLHIRLGWSRGQDPIQEPLAVSIRIESTDRPGINKRFSKLIRKYQERRQRKIWRTRWDITPGGGTVLPTRLPPPPHAAIQDLELELPGNLDLGRYLIRVAVAKAPLVPNYRVQDLVSDNDLYLGVVADTVQITASSLPPANR